MVLVSRRWLLAVLAVGVASVLCLGIVGYLLLAASSGRAVEEAKLSAENLLYLCLVLGAVLAVLSAALLLRSRGVSKELDRIVALAHSSAQQVQQRLARLGPLGGRINALTAALNDVSERRLVRLSALNATVAALVTHGKAPLALLEVTGRVVAASPAFKEKLALEGEPTPVIADLLPGLDFPAVVGRLERTRMPQPWNEGAESCGFHPVFDRRNELANVVCVLGRLEIASVPDGERGGNGTAIGRMGRVLRRYLARGKDPRRPG